MRNALRNDNSSNIPVILEGAVSNHGDRLTVDDPGDDHLRQRAFVFIDGDAVFVLGEVEQRTPVLRKGDKMRVGTALQRRCLTAHERIRHIHGTKGVAVTKGAVADGRDMFRQNNRCRTGAVEGVIADFHRIFRQDQCIRTGHAQ